MRIDFESKLIEHLRSENEQVHYVSLIYSILNRCNVEDPHFDVHKKIINSIELLKASTLIIDDIIDNTDIRDGQDSFLKQFGINNGIIAGELLKSHSTIAFIESINALPLPENVKIRCILVFEDSYRTVLKGQYDDINSLYFRPEMKKWDKATWSIYFRKYLSIIYNTTSVFLQIPYLIIKTMQADQNKWENAYDEYFRFLGLAYQLRDDIIDSVSTQGESGKCLGGDIVEKKIRLPMILFFRDTEMTDLKIEVFELLNLSSDGIALQAKRLIDILYQSNSVKQSIEFLNSGSATESVGENRTMVA